MDPAASLERTPSGTPRGGWSPPGSPEPSSGTADVAPEVVVARRCGDVLLRHTILKADHFPGCQNAALGDAVPGAPNFRQVAGLPIYGTAIPTAAGVRAVLDALRARGPRRGEVAAGPRGPRPDPFDLPAGAERKHDDADAPLADPAWRSARGPAQGTAAGGPGAAAAAVSGLGAGTGAAPGLGAGSGACPVSPRPLPAASVASSSLPPPPPVVLWFNLREEPVVYINGTPYVVREAERPFANLEYTGIDRDRVESMEQRLKADVLAEAGRYGSATLVAGENDDFQVCERWEPVSESDVQTPAEVYRELAEDGYRVEYLRVPITDEKAPKPRDFELLVSKLWAAPKDAALVFNCQMGRGRTTTGMVIATLLALRKRLPPGAAFAPPRPLEHALDDAEIRREEREMREEQDKDAKPLSSASSSSLSSSEDESEGGGADGVDAGGQRGVDGAASSAAPVPIRGRAAHPAADPRASPSLSSPRPPSSAPRSPAEAQFAARVPPWFEAPSAPSAAPLRAPAERLEADLRAGMFGAVRALLRVLPGSQDGKATLDLVLDACSAMQNLRSAIADYRGRLARESNDGRRAALLRVALEYLERYYVLIAFATYLGDPAFKPLDPARRRALHHDASRGSLPGTPLAGGPHQTPFVPGSFGAGPLPGGGLAALAASGFSGSFAAAAAEASRGGPSGGGLPGGAAADATFASAHVPFGAWVAARPELRSVLARLLRADPIRALALDADASAAGRGAARGAAGGSSDDEEGGPQGRAVAERAALVASRTGAVLGPYTLLKQDHFPGCQSERLRARVPGAPNFRGIAGVRVFGGGVPTLEGIRRVLRLVGAGPAGGGSGGAPGLPARAVWTVMREEPVVLIKGLPYVLRDSARPFKNLLEYRGIDAARLDLMESRLREDVLAEAAAHGGRLLVVREETGEVWTRDADRGVADAEGGTEGAKAPRPGAVPAPSARPLVEDAARGTVRGAALASEPPRRLVDDWVSIDSPADVTTLRTAFFQLQGEGYRVSYCRVPVTDGVPPSPREFDEFYAAAAAAAPTDALIYSCQLGGGRTTTGMVVGTLLRKFLNGMEPGPLDEEELRGLDELDDDVGGASPPNSDDEREDRRDDDDGDIPDGIGLLGSFGALAVAAGDRAAGDAPAPAAAGADAHDAAAGPAIPREPHPVGPDGRGPRDPRSEQGRGDAARGKGRRVAWSERGKGEDAAGGPEASGKGEDAASGPEASAPAEAPAEQQLQTLQRPLAKELFGDDAAAASSAASSAWGDEHEDAGRAAALAVEPPAAPGGAAAAAAGAGSFTSRRSAELPPGVASSRPGSPGLLPPSRPRSPFASEGRVVPARRGEALPDASRASDWDVESLRLRDGEYVGVLRVTRILESGSEAKAAVDAAVDAAGAIINLRSTIARYRVPARKARFYRPEIGARHAAFSRGAAFLERYCLLIAFASYLRRCAKHGRRQTFAQWYAARPEIQAALDAVRSNPAGALLPAPRPRGRAALLATPRASSRRSASGAATPKGPHAVLYGATVGAPAAAPSADRSLASSFRRPGAGAGLAPGGLSAALASAVEARSGGSFSSATSSRFGRRATPEEERVVLSRRRGALLGKRIVLKSLPRDPDATARLGAVVLPGMADVRVVLAPVGYGRTFGGLSDGFGGYSATDAGLGALGVAAGPFAPDAAWPSPAAGADPYLDGPGAERSGADPSLDPAYDATVFTSLDSSLVAGDPTSPEGSRGAGPALEPLIVTVGDCTTEGFRQLLLALGAGPGGSRHASICDLREEMAVIVRGTAYLRRDLATPAASMHHAGISAARLEEAERRLRADLLAESLACGGSVLLHREDVQRDDGRDASGSAEAAGTAQPAIAAAPDAAATAAAVASAPATPGASAEGARLSFGRRPSSGGLADLGGVAPQEDVTRPEPDGPRVHALKQQHGLATPGKRLAARDGDGAGAGAAAGPAADAPHAAAPGALVPASATAASSLHAASHGAAASSSSPSLPGTVEAFWCPLDALGVGDPEEGAATPLEAALALAAEGFSTSYRRVPLSRERTPAATDLDALLLAAEAPPEGRRSLVYVLLSRAATGSSARFAAAVLMARARSERARERAAVEAMNGGLYGAAGVYGAAGGLWPASPPAPLVPRRRPGLLGSSLGASPVGSGGLRGALQLELAGAGAGAGAVGLSRGGIGGAIAVGAHAPPPGAGSLRRDSSDFSELSRSLANGEWRGILNLCRVLRNGPDAKALADAAIDACGAVGNLRLDVLRCALVASGRVLQEQQAEARRAEALRKAEKARLAAKRAGGPGAGGVLPSPSAAAAAASSAPPAPSAAPPTASAPSMGQLGSLRSLTEPAWALPQGASTAREAAPDAPGTPSTPGAGEGPAELPDPAEREAEALAAAATARHLGLHYLKRYFFLIAFAGYLEALPPPRAVPFSQWTADRHELKYLLKTLDLE